MHIADPLYGEFQLDNVLVELIQSQPVQRLKKIHQGGASYLVNPDWEVTRYEHSVGVMLLIKKVGGSIAEQIVGLLHDISHTAFSHVIDFALDNQHEDYHEQIYQHVVLESEIPSILAKYAYDSDDILFNQKKWTLLEQSAPELCADRIDYTIRDMHRYGHISIKEVQTFLDHLIVVNGRLYLDQLDAATWFMETYHKEVIDFFLDPLNVYGYDRLARVLKIALTEKIIHFNDLLTDDNTVMTKLKDSQQPQIQSYLSQLHSDVIVQAGHQCDYDVYRKSKIRLVDPSIWDGYQLVSASQLSEHAKAVKETTYQKAQTGAYVKIFSVK
ncbi:HD domain-containing protein [Amphibacillus cookii]|uniref:HD domain-containing protein n=1 Tax=Amphibacillus cookii TaxID=767787 RepID=UPI00195E0020|nr:HD domain-containing protein [Amphibacillus cookii]MBM7542671.1 HD superfamily phosphohydrolase [Amphibacillus cookii]